MLAFCVLFSPTPACIEGEVPLFIDGRDFGRIALHIGLYKGKHKEESIKPCKKVQE